MKIANPAHYDYKNWRRSFAWLPHETNDDGWRWLEWLERKNVTGDEFSGACHEYRMLKPPLGEGGGT